jgi:hypothetical protein
MRRAERQESGRSSAFRTAKLLALVNALPAVAAASPTDKATFRELADPYFETVGLASEDPVDRGARVTPQTVEQANRLARRAAMKKAAAQ